MADKAILAYSGGLDTSVAIRWLNKEYGVDVIALTVDIGQDTDFEKTEKRALDVGAVKAVVADMKDVFAKQYIARAIKANALYEGKYPLATALGRPLIACCLVEEAKKYKAKYIAHGCTAKGNDQVRLDIGIKTLNPALKIIAPLREWKLTREQEIDYAAEEGIEIDVTKKKSYSIDENLWGRSIEGGDLEDPRNEPLPKVYRMTRDPSRAPEKPAYVDIEFRKGVPVALNGKRMDLVSLIGELNGIAGKHGYGRIDMLENRLIGIKSREIYEAPAAMAIINAHMALEDMVLERDLAHYKSAISGKYAELIYNGLWFSPLRHAIDAFIEETQRYLSGTVKVKFYKGSIAVTSRESGRSLYDHSLATYEAGDKFPHDSAVGFIDLWGMPLINWAKKNKEKGS
jgi:argininosuccinate synthase